MELSNSIIILIILLLVIFAWIIFPLDFIGIGVTRNLVSRVSNDVSLKPVLRMFLLDTLVKAVIFPILAIFWCIPILVAFIESIKYFAHRHSEYYSCRFICFANFNNIY